MNVTIDNRQHMKQHALRSQELERIARNERLARQVSQRPAKRSPLSAMARLVALFL
jgi:hypothetical protein